MKLYLRDLNLELVEEWKKVFGSEVNISFGGIFEDGEHMNCDAIISPANSFGFMDGGIDYIYSNYFGWDLDERLREKIVLEFKGELLVGHATVVPTNKPTIKHLISAPTMRTPEDVSKTVNAYLSFRAALRMAKEYEFESILCPGMGGSIGRYSPRVCAKQMKKAYDDYEKLVVYDTLGDAYKEKMNLIG